MSRRFVAQWNETKYGGFYKLIDTKTGNVVGTDETEPEDATLGRSFSWVCKALNDVFEGKDPGYPDDEDEDDS